jgi:hypothetical protein
MQGSTVDIKSNIGGLQEEKKNLNMARIDYQKEFHSVLHSWIEKLIELTGVNNKIVKFCKFSMEKWSINLQLKTN